MIVRNLLVAYSVVACAFFNSYQITYLDENWEVTTKDKMTFYREFQPQGKQVLIKDYYKSGVANAEMGTRFYFGRRDL